MRRPSLAVYIVLLMVSIVALTALVQAQYGASLEGTVTDKSGAVVARATVTVTNQETGVVYPAVTSDSGLYRVSALVPGRYSVKAEAANFKTKSVTNIAVAAEESKNQDVALELGAVSESVTVTADAVALQTENGDVSGSITAQDVQRLPQVGRDPFELLRLAPGVLGDNARQGTGNAATFIPGTEALGGASNEGIFQTENQPQISANGQRVSSNNYEIDGVSVNSLGLGGAAVVTPSEESVKEVKVVTSSYTAEDGRNVGAQIKVISQNGTNKFHGSGVIVFDDKGLNAFNKYYGPQSITPSLLTCQDNTKVFASQCPQRVDTKQRLFGASLGGPIFKDKLFFFFSYEGLRSNNSTFANEWIETPEFRTYIHNVRPGSLADQLFSFPGVVPRIISAGLIPPSVPNGNPIQGQLGLSYDIGSLNGVAIGQHVPGCTAPCPGFFDGVPDVTFANVALPSSSDANQYHLRMDYNRSKDQFGVSGYLTLLNNVGTFGSGRPFQDHPFKPKNNAAMVTWIHTFSPTILNEARFNFTRFFDDEFSNVSQNLHIPQLDTNGFNIAGGPGLGLPGGGGLQYGADFNLPKILAENTFEFRDILSKQVGNKTWKFGAQIIREQDNSLQRQHARPEFAFDNILSLANDAPFFENSADIDPATGGTPHSRFYFRATSYNFFVQNDWKVRHNLTVNLGVRYEYTTPISEKNGRLSNYIPGPNGIIDGHVGPVSRLYDPDRNNFAPRIGFAYSPALAGDKLVFRGGFGVGYDRQFFNLVQLARFNPPFAAAGIGLCCDASGGILYSFSLPNDPLDYPPNPALKSGIDPVTGGLLAPAPVTLPGGFVRNDQYIEVDGSPKHLPVTYVYNYSFEMQYQLLRSMFLSLAYEGSAGHKLIRTIDMNRFTPGDSFNCITNLQGNPCANNKDMVQEADVNGNPITPRLTGNPNFDRIFFPLPDVNANFNSMVLHVNKSYGHGFQLDGSYRWSKSLDTSSFGRGAQQTDPSQQSLDYGPSDFDVRHQFVFYGLWDLPIYRGQRGFAGKALGGWQINGILTVHSGFPWTPEQGCCFFGTPGGAANDINGDGIGNDFPTQWDGQGGTASSNQTFINGVFPKNAAHPNGGFDYFNIIPPGPCPNFPVNCITARQRGNNGIGRNRFRGPAYRQIDMTLGKHTTLPGFLHLGEAAALDLRANFFNIFNMLNLPPFQTGGQSNTDFTNTNDFSRATQGLAGRVVEFQIRLSF
jgi:Carboxypeptidase regulatory-like domain/TonB dependent receptor